MQIKVTKVTINSKSAMVAAVDEWQARHDCLSSH